MNWLRALGHGERVVLVVALGIVLCPIAAYVAAPSTHYGWVAYAPLIKVGPHAGGVDGWRILIWTAFVVVWAVCSIWLLRTKPPARRDSRN